MEKLLGQLTEKLKKALEGRLKSIVLYGSAAGGSRDKWSDFNVFCVVDEVDRGALGGAEPVVRWWREQGQPSPLLMGEAEVRASTDCFAIEFHDMLERREVLYGADPIAGLEIDDSFYRAQVEHELRAKLIRLRQKAAAAMVDQDLLIRLMGESVSTFLVLGRHALRLAGRQAPFAKREIALTLEEAFGTDSRPFYTLLSLREGAVKLRQSEAGELFDAYVNSIQSVVAAVDAMER
jgi:predicted nucleotidyltransferase